MGTWDYTPFGVVTTATGGANSDGVGVTRFLFAGEYQDDSGLTYLRARFYDPVTASFLSVDPALSATGSPYAYASGNPLQLVDPVGLFSLPNPLGGVTNFLNDTVRHLTRGGSAGDVLEEFVCRFLGGFFSPDDGADFRSMLGFANDARGKLRETWSEARYMLNVANPVSAIPAQKAWEMAVSSGAECEWESTEKFWVCYGAKKGYMPNSGGTQYGSVFVTPWSKEQLADYGAIYGMRTIPHEAKHSDLEAFIGSPGLGLLVVASGINNAAAYLLATGDPVLAALNAQRLFQCNGVEQEAGFKDGGYKQCL